MSTIKELLQELEQEAQTTRRVLERVPTDRLAWKPHDKSMSLGQLALHIAVVPGAIAEISRQSPVALPQFEHPSPASAAELIPALDQSLAKVREILGKMDETALSKTWRVMDGDREVMAIPVGALLRTIMLNHWYHHRGQLSVYLRQVGVPVPSIYGPSADENPFAARKASAVGA
ncbi:MAG: damage-inducible protein DinB [Acidobacteria bacterium]|nr:MAG: damage-inducible protein DinB [Acidobacteriota bacterium]